MGHRFRPENIERLDNPERRKMLPPDQILSSLQVEMSHVIADIGCGIGYFTIPVAKQTRELVYAIDVEPQMLTHLQNRMEEANVHNITTLQGNAESVPLQNESVDRIICSLILHEVDDLDRAIQEMKRVLRKKGKILIIEWEKKETQAGPPLSHRIAASDLLSKLDEFGWDCRASKPNSDQYLLIADLRQE